ncbi:hypothetical protein [Lentzea flava]|uniref:Uncharacterized protein n=1 Tax=Lentzea flava TaxID=103732 RepID=A0ABQ2UXJ5_9PSEU|nr:hypothetical protein [Lentzea flava]GGU59039.1 hypothetical protein GCM10010178_59050 [Lentzea flava]
MYAAIDEVNGWRDPLNSIKVVALDLDGNEVRPKEPLRKYVVGAARLEVDEWSPLLRHGGAVVPG